MFLHLLSACLCLVSYASAEEKVPVISWNIKGSSLQVQSVSAFEKEPKDSVLKNVLEGKPFDDSVHVVAFLLDDISMEDLALAPSAGETSKNLNLKTLEEFLDKQQYSLYPSVSEPLKHLRKSNCGVYNIHVSDETESSLSKSISKALEDSCVVIVHLPDDRSFSRDLYLPSVKGDQNVIGLFTGRRASWVPLEPSKRQVRSLLAVEAEDEHFINLTGCIMMYVENVTLQIGMENDTRQLDFPPNVDGRCGNATEEAVLELTFPNAGDISAVIIKMRFVQMFGAWSLANDSSLTLDGGRSYSGEWELNTDSFEAPRGFSFSCGEMRLRPANRTIPLTIKMSRFQIQPFISGSKFTESFDCVPFFTLPIWMGIFVGLLFIAILNTGIYALFIIKTMDRFDDPKGKTISVPN